MSDRRTSRLDLEAIERRSAMVEHLTDALRRREPAPVTDFTTADKVPTKAGKRYAGWSREFATTDKVPIAGKRYAEE